MERALDPELLALALDGAPSLPTPEALGQLLADSELSLLLHGPEVRPELLRTGWYLHGVASAYRAVELYGVPRQRACFRIAAHIFDLALKGLGEHHVQRFRLGFAAQVAYLRSELDPNTIAIYRRDLRPYLARSTFAENPTGVALERAAMLLGMDTYPLLVQDDPLRREIESLRDTWGVESFYATPFATAAAVVLATRSIARFLVYGQRQELERAASYLQRALDDQAHDGDRDARWVAYHLLALTGGLDSTSVWSVLPPQVPTSVKRAFALASPQVLTLWPPQVDLLAGPGAINPLDTDARRVFLATPTSGGKTLIAQLIIASHLATEATDVCYVAPTRTLCREVRMSLARRLRFLQAEVAPDLGDVIDSAMERQGSVEVMTPERLSHMLHVDSSGVMERFGLFVFDEIHNIDEDRRGWTLETTVAFLHKATLESRHRMILMSAAVGNRNHFVEWLGGEGAVRHRHSDWRGPRRLHCIWTTDAAWNEGTIQEPRRRNGRRKESVPLYGFLHARIGQSGQVVHLRTDDPVGQLVFDINDAGRRLGSPKREPAGYKMLLEIAEHLAHDGPVLIIEATRPQSIATARALAERLGEADNPPTALVDLVTLRLGAEHPLVGIARAGVAYHHGSLPMEIRQAIEDAVSTGAVHYLVATTTMTEGVNLPVRSVIIARQGAFTSNGEYEEYITGSVLINAIGRAGRATRETEGIVVLARDSSYSSADFNQLQPSDENTRVTSWIATEAALAELAEFEDAARAAEDAVIAFAGEHIAAFVSFIWFIAWSLNRRAVEVSREAVESYLEDTLGWVQLPETARDRWRRVADAVTQAYTRTDETSRRRWASADRRLSSARVLEEIAQALASAAAGASAPFSNEDVLDFLLETGAVNRMLGLTEAPRRRAYTSRGGGRVDVTPDLRLVLKAWISGRSHLDLATEFFGQIPDVGYRFEQLGDYLNDYFEVYLPTCVATAVAWGNEIIAGMPFQHDDISALILSLPTELASYIRLGVNDRHALDLMLGGLSSRRLALAAAAAYLEADTTVGIQEWIGGKSLVELRRLFQPSLPELRELADFSGNASRGLAARILNGELVELECALSVSPDVQNAGVVLGFGDTQQMEPIVVFLHDTPVGIVPTSAYSALVELRGSGLVIDARASYGDPACVITLQLVEPPEGELIA